MGFRARSSGLEVVLEGTNHVVFLISQRLEQSEND